MSSERCYFCGSWALTEDDGGLRCKDCGVEAPARFFAATRKEAALDATSSTYAGLAVACKDGPPRPSPFTARIAAEMRKLGRPWPAGEIGTARVIEGEAYVI